MSIRQIATGDLPEANEGRVPASALVVSVLALAVAGLANFAWPTVLPEYSVLLWLLALIPPFLLAYHKGWQGAAMALAAGMVLLIGVEVGGSLLTDRAIRWWTVGAVIGLLIGVSLGAGALAGKLRRQARDALQLAYADALTGLPNRRILDLFLSKEFAGAQRGATLSVAIFDVDDFKAFNDRHGHTAGDEALQVVARILDHNTRAEDVSGRLAGDEFLTLLLGETSEGAHTFAKRVCGSLAGGRPGDRITLSAGIATFSPVMLNPKELLDAADRALYAAKGLGGDRVVVNAEAWEEEPTAGGGMLLLRSNGEVQSPGYTEVRSSPAPGRPAPAPRPPSPGH